MDLEKFKKNLMRYSRKDIIITSHARVRALFRDIDLEEVKKGDVLASLESRETLAVYTVSAPLDGVVVAKDASVGESALEDRVLFEVANLSSVWADISVFPKFQHLVRKVYLMLIFIICMGKIYYGA